MGESYSAGLYLGIARRRKCEKRDQGTENGSCPVFTVSSFISSDSRPIKTLKLVAKLNEVTNSNYSFHYSRDSFTFSARNAYEAFFFLSPEVFIYLSLIH